VKNADRILVLAIAAALLLMLLLVLAPGPGAPEGGGLAGQPRNVDVDLLRRRLIRRELSDHEALYYR
jgi:hypothetical protein